MRRWRVHGIILVACVALIVGAPPATARTDQGNGIATTLVNFDGAGNQLVRFDTQGNAIDAHEGQIALFGSTYYFYGTGYGCGFREYHPTSFCGFNVYSSTDLVHWVNQGTLFDATTDYWQALCGHGEGCFRPHVIYNASTQRYVLWFSAAQATNGYVVMDSTSPTGRFVPRPAPQLAVGNDGASTMSYQGDESLFVDDDNTAYLIHTDWRRQGDMVIEQLDPAYESATGRYVRLQVSHNEAPTMFKHDGIYYVMTSDPNCAYCAGTGTGYLTAPSPLGPWSGDGPTPPPYWQVNNGTLFANGGGPGFSLPGYDWTDYTFSFDTQPLTTTDGGYAQSGWFLRAENESGPNNVQMGGYVWSLTNNPSTGANGGALVETIMQNGRAISHTVELPFPVAANAWYHVATTAVGGTMTTTVQAITPTVSEPFVEVMRDTTYTRGRAGFIESSVNGESARFNNVSVTAPDGTQLLNNDFSQFDPPLAPRQTLKISATSCGGQPADVVALPGKSGPLYLYLSDLWSNGDMPGLSNYYLGLLSFTGNGSIAPLTCQSSIPLTLEIGSPQQQITPPDLDQSSGNDGFRLQCDVGNTAMRLQTFIPSRSGTLTTLYFTTYQYYFGTSAPLELDVVALDGEGHPISTLYRGTVASGGIRNAADVVTVAPDLGVVAGQPYGIVARSATGVGCYGSAYSDSNPYSAGQEYLSTDGGVTWHLEPGRALKFAVSVSPTAPTATPSSSPVEAASATATAFPTSVPPATATPIATPAIIPPNTSTAVSNPPAYTATPANMSSSMPASIPTPMRHGPATATPVSPDTPTAIRTSKRTLSVAKKMPARPISFPLTVRVTPASVRYSNRLVVLVRTLRKAHIEIALRVKTTRIRTIKSGRRRKRITYAVLLYNVTRSGMAGSAGRYTATIRIAYRAARVVQAHLTVMARAGRKTTTWHGQIRILPGATRIRSRHHAPHSGRHAAQSHSMVSGRHCPLGRH